MRAQLSIRQPIIAAVNGDAIGLGATLALFCDLVLMADHARIGDGRPRGTRRHHVVGVGLSGLAELDHADAEDVDLSCHGTLLGVEDGELVSNAHIALHT